MGYLYGRQEKNQKAGRCKMRSEWIKKAAAALLAALLLELIPCQFSFWTTVAKKTQDLTARAEILAGYTAIEELDQERRCGNARRSDNGRRQRTVPV